MRPSLSVAAPKVELQNMDAEAVGGTCRRGLLKRWYPLFEPGMSVEALGTPSSRSAFFSNAPSWGLAFPGGGWSDDLMLMCEGERPVDCEG